VKVCSIYRKRRGKSTVPSGLIPHDDLGMIRSSPP
jgi:hypothetical protein